MVINDTLGSERRPLPGTASPIPPAPEKAITVNDWWNDALLCVAVTAALTSGPEVVAVQTSAVPIWVFARFTSVQTSPPPETFRVCFVVAFGPSDEAKATSSSPALATLITGVVIVPLPSTETIASTCGVPTDAPAETTRSMAPPATRVAPATGDWLITDPAGTFALGATDTLPTVKPATAIWLLAVACVRPTTFGTVRTTSAGAVATTSATALLLATCVPAAGV